MIVAEGSPAELIARYSTREVLELRFAPGTQRRRSTVVRAAGGPGRGPAGPAAALHRRRRARCRPSCAHRGCSRCPRWCVARRWRTCSCGSPAGVWWSDGANSPAPATGRAAGPLGGVLLVVEHHWTWYRRNWRATAVSSILQPLLFLLAFGVGFGTLIDGTGRAAQATGGLDYLVWLAPALLGVSAVQTAVFDSTYPVLSGLKWQRHLPRHDGHADRPGPGRGRAPGLDDDQDWRLRCGLRRGHRGVRRACGHRGSSWHC